MTTPFLNFAVGPVMSEGKTLEIAAQQIPYFRTNEFSSIMLENENLFKKMLNAEPSSRVIFMTGSGTSSMEAAVLNVLTRLDRALVVNGGSFGQRFCEICEIHEIPYDAIVCEAGKTLTREQLSQYDGSKYTAFIVNLGETSTGVLYDIDFISEYCKKNSLLLIIDAVSSFLCDPLDMSSSGADVVITGSQKALAIAPGLSLICLSKRAQERVENNAVRSLYFDLKRYLKDGERGQTPFTPAVGILLQLNARLMSINDKGGASAEISATKSKADYFRKNIANIPLSLFADKMSNAVTSLTISNRSISAYKVFEILKDKYKIWVCPNGGALREKVFRVGHMGCLSNSDYDRLITALRSVL